MKQSHSSISTFINCQKLYKYLYVDKIKLKENEHMRLGTLVHLVLSDWSKLPSEELYLDLKQYFEINSWNNYFNQIKSQLDLLLNNYDVLYRELPLETEELKGIIDLVLRDKTTGRILLIDYKTSFRSRSITELLYDQQLYLYVYLYHVCKKEPITNISIGIITIPKEEIGPPALLKNGTLSKNKNQNTTEELYLEAIKLNNLNKEDYLDILEFFSNKKYIEFIESPLNISLFVNIIKNTENAIKMINYAEEHNIFLVNHSYLHLDCDCVKISKLKGEFNE